MSLVEYDGSSSDDEQTPITQSTGSASNKPQLQRLVDATARTVRTSVQIAAPKIPTLDSDDSDDDGGPTKKAKLGSNSSNQPRSGLFAKLPAPVNAPPTGRKSKNETMLYKFKSTNSQSSKIDSIKSSKSADSKTTSTSAVPSISEIRKRSAAAAAKMLSSTSVKDSGLKNESDDEDQDTGFFSFVEKIDVIPEAETPEVGTGKESVEGMGIAPVVDYISPTEIPSASSWQSTMPYANTNSNVEPAWDSNITQNSQEMLRLQGKQNRNEKLNFIDFHEEDALRGGKEMLLKTISEEKGLDRTRVNVPGGMMKKKHQLPYLIQQAKAREVELKNTWAQNRQSKQQTQSKYGW